MHPGAAQSRATIEYRSHRPRALVLAVVLALCVAIGWSGQLTESGTVTQASAAPSAPKRFFGFTPDFGAVDDATLTAYYKRLRRGGARWVRFGVYWWFIERNRGNRTWYSTDRFFAATACSRAGRAPHVHRSASMGLGKVQHHRSTEADLSAPVQGHDPARHSPIRSARLLLEETASLPRWQRSGSGAARAQMAGLERAQRDELLRGRKSHCAGLRATSDGRRQGHQQVGQSTREDGARWADGQPGNRLPEGSVQGEWPHLNARVDIFDVHAYASTPLELPQAC